MKISGQAQYIKETNQEKFYNGTTGFQAGEFTVKVKILNLMIERIDILQSYSKMMKVNNTNTINLFHLTNMISKKNN